MHVNLMKVSGSCVSGGDSRDKVVSIKKDKLINIQLTSLFNVLGLRNKKTLPCAGAFNLLAGEIRQ